MIAFSRCLVESTWRGLFPSCQCSSHLVTMLANEFPLATRSAVFSTFRRAIGPMPVASNFLPPAWLSRAVPSKISEYFAGVMSFSLRFIGVGPPIKTMYPRAAGFQEKWWDDKNENLIIY